MQLKISKRALSEIGAATLWWRANRLASPRLLELEPEHAFTMLELQPFIAPRVFAPELSEVRRMVLRETRYLLYYRVREELGIVEVLRLWHTSRRGRPSPR